MKLLNRAIKRNIMFKETEYVKKDRFKARFIISDLDQQKDLNVEISLLETLNPKSIDNFIQIADRKDNTGYVSKSFY